MSLLSLLQRMLEMGASDLHLLGGNPPIFRINGDIMISTLPPLDIQNLEKILMPLLNAEYSQRFYEVGEIDFAIEVKNLARFRINYFLQHQGMGAVFRLIPITPIEIGSLGLPLVISTIAEFKKGLIIVTGPTGSGKTTTLAAMISHMNRHRNAHVITIEDPLEFVHASDNCLITHREAGVHANSFADALKSALREDPNIILVGEMRDMETMDLALKAAEMGLLVLTTLHTVDAAKSVDRIIDSFPLKQQDQIRLVLSQTLKAVVAQQLIKRKDLTGRVPAVEVLIATKGLASLIRDAKTHQIPSIIQTGAEYGMQTMDQSFIELIKKDIVKKETIRNKISDFKLFERAGIFF
jgi:twitching motility protein PilT